MEDRSPATKKRSEAAARLSEAIRRQSTPALTASVQKVFMSMSSGGTSLKTWMAATPAARVASSRVPTRVTARVTESILRANP